jgi:hypothetical protein
VWRENVGLKEYRQWREIVDLKEYRVWREIVDLKEYRVWRENVDLKEYRADLAVFNSLRCSQNLGNIASNGRMINEL